jgi:hypothetical protein
MMGHMHKFTLLELAERVKVKPVVSYLCLETMSWYAQGILSQSTCAKFLLGYTLLQCRPNPGSKKNTTKRQTRMQKLAQTLQIRILLEAETYSVDKKPKTKRARLTRPRLSRLKVAKKTSSQPWLSSSVLKLLSVFWSTKRET